MQWFRMYSETLDDPKVQRLPADLFKVWVNLLCLTAKHEGKLPAREDIAFALRMSDEDCGAALFDLSQRGLLDVDETGAVPHNWGKRQFKSDVSAERVARYRKRHGNGARNVTETPPETDTDTDTEKKEIEGASAPPPSVTVVTIPLPKPKQRATRWPADAVVPDDWIAWARERRPDVNPDLEAESFANYWPAHPDGLKLDWRKTWNNWIIRAKASHAKRPDAVSELERAANLARLYDEAHSHGVG